MIKKKIRRRELISSLIGVLVYVLLQLSTNAIQLPSGGYVTFHPVVAIPLFFGILFGSWVGFIVGFLGSSLSDLVSGFGLQLWAALGVGLMGFIAGLVADQITHYPKFKSILWAEGFCAAGIIFSAILMSVSDIWISGADMKTVIFVDFFPTVIPDLINGLIIILVLMLLYQSLLSRRTV